MGLIRGVRVLVDLLAVYHAGHTITYQDTRQYANSNVAKRLPVLSQVTVIMQQTKQQGKTTDSRHRTRKDRDSRDSEPMATDSNE
jgi:hypothetical protein